ncbi:unnamed protein product [Owenia fusiformis]|uniref:Uncharacterized protein n=1 Tax=Owenia fusiformis TaxID=6347 RepID=A0A8J1U2C8_OWEFU|nr:unnamed protein product [Owenia fusiformis]
METILMLFILLIPAFYSIEVSGANQCCGTIKKDVTKMKTDIDDLKKLIDLHTKDSHSHDECIGKLLVTGSSHRIPDSWLTASTVYEFGYGPDRARLGTQDIPGETQRGSWVASVKDSNQWIQADLGKVMTVSGVITQGRNILGKPTPAADQWVSEYRILYRTYANMPFERIQERFQGNSDRVTPVLNMFKSVKARYVRINPTVWKNHISMRFDVIGC